MGFWVGFGVFSVLLGGIGTIGEYWALRLPTGEYSALLGPSGGVFGTIGAYWGMFGTTGADSGVFGVTGAFWGGGIRRYWGLQRGSRKQKHQNFICPRKPPRISRETHKIPKETA